MAAASTVLPVDQHRSRWKWAADLAAIDLRALAFLRIGVAVILLVDLAYRARDLEAFYTDSGILPREGVKNLAIRYCEPWWMSLHMASGSVIWAGILALVAGIAAFALLLGWRTKIALFVSWLLLYSIQARFPMLLQGGDVVLRCTLVWMFFLPVDARWSVTRSSVETPKNNRIASIGALGLIVQLGSVYFFSALLKTSPMWVGDFSATHYALNIDHFTKPLGYWLLDYPVLLQCVTFGSIVLEFCGPLLMIEPIGRRFWRWLIPISFIGFHLGLYLSMDLGTFPWICIICWTALLPIRFWDGIEWLAAQSSRPRTMIVQDSPTSAIWTGSIAANAIASFLILYVLSLNAAKVRHPYARVGGFPICHLGQVTGLEQYWNMFAPGPYAYGGWVRVEGCLRSGELVNLADPHIPLADHKPANVSSSYPTQYWRRCFVMGYEVRERPHLEGLLRHLSHKWNSSHSAFEQVVKARLVFMKTPTPPPLNRRQGQKRDPAIREVLCELEMPGRVVAAR